MNERLNVRPLAHAEKHEIVVKGPRPAVNSGPSGIHSMAKVVSVRRGMTISAFDLVDHNQIDGEHKTDPCVSFTFLFNGSGDGWFFDDQRCKSVVIPLQPGRLYCSLHYQAVSGRNQVRPGSRFRGVDIRLDWDVWHRMAIGLDQSNLSQDHPYHHASGTKYWHGVLPVSPELRNLNRVLFNNVRDGTSDLTIEATGLEIIDSVQRLLGQQKTPQTLFAKDETVVQSVKDSIERDLERNWTVASLADLAGVSVGRLKKVFPAHTGLPVFQYLQEYRLTRAKNLLETSDLSVTEIAFLVGYTSMSHFSSIFRRRFGVTPSSVKRQGY